uniref:Integrase catalytic domain-containing protein n=1 Tax=Amphimedon queenslandica TaxID=400682 RepID=A0A1X7UTK1_AMPQE
MRNKLEVPDKFKEFEAIACNQTGLKISTLHSDNGGEYLSNDFEEYLKGKGIRHKCTIPYSIAQNGMAERMNRTTVESARTMISCAGLLQSYWREAVVTAAFIRNRIPTITYKEKVLPYERWFGRKPDLSPLKIFAGLCGLCPLPTLPSAHCRLQEKQIG